LTREHGIELPDTSNPSPCQWNWRKTCKRPYTLAPFCKYFSWRETSFYVPTVEFIEALSFLYPPSDNLFFRRGGSNRKWNESFTLHYLGLGISHYSYW